MHTLYVQKNIYTEDTIFLHSIVWLQIGTYVKFFWIISKPHGVEMADLTL